MIDKSLYLIAYTCIKYPVVYRVNYIYVISICPEYFHYDTSFSHQNQGIYLEGIRRVGKQDRAVFLPIIMVSEVM